MKQGTLRKFVSAGLLLIIVVIFSLTASSFLTWRNINSILREVSVVGLLSIGVSFVIIGGGIDLSTGTVLGLSAMAASRLLTDSPLPVWMIVIVVIAAGVLLGVVNGLLVVKIGMTEFIATFAMMYVYRGIVFMIAYREDGRMVTKSVSDAAFLAIGGKVGGIYYMSVIWAAVVAVSWFVLKETVFGTHVYAIGTNAKSARLSGINVPLVKISTFMISGGCAALAGIFLLAWQGSAGLNTGTGMEFQAIAAAVVGGIVLSGGRGDTIGVAIGSIFMVSVVNGLYKYGLATEFQTIAYWAVIIIMSVFDSLYLRWMDRRHIVNKKAAGKAEGEAA